MDAGGGSEVGRKQALPSEACVLGDAWRATRPPPGALLSNQCVVQ